LNVRHKARRLAKSFSDMADTNCHDSLASIVIKRVMAEAKTSLALSFRRNKLALENLYIAANPAEENSDFFCRLVMVFSNLRKFNTHFSST